MKKLGLILFCCLALSAAAQQDGRWCFGLQWGLQGNKSELSGGMQTANARFHHNSYGSGSLNFNLRYDHSKHWMLMTGLGFGSYGYEFALSQNYSLLKGQEAGQYNKLRSSFGTLTVPAMVFYKFNPNCKNAKWLIGAGYVQNLSGDQSISQTYLEGAEGNPSGNYLKTTATNKGGISGLLRLEVGREKVFQNGRILMLTMLFNAGLKQSAHADVTYRIDGQDYNHSFTNKGNFVGLRLSWYFRSIKNTGITKN